MWSDLIPKVQEKFDELRLNGWESVQANEPEHFDEVIALYEKLTWEMVEGMKALFVKLIVNQNYVTKKLNIRDTTAFQQSHLNLVERLEEAVHEDVKRMPQFYILIRIAVENLMGYCILLKQELAYYFYKHSHLKKDRRLRQIYLHLIEVLEGFSRLKKQCDLLLKLIGGSKDQIVDTSKEELLELLENSMFDEKEKELLRLRLE